MNQLQREPAETMSPAPGVLDGATTSLQQELSKWRERVPPLVAALRERTEQLERLQAEVAELRQGQQGREDGQDTPGVQARDAVINELEAELAALRETHARTQGDVHAREVAIADLKRDLQSWKTKWQSLAERLDATSAADPAALRRLDAVQQANTELDLQIAALRQRLADAEGERDELQARNASLFETTRLANRQLETLADDLSVLRGELKALRADNATVSAARDVAEAQRAAAATDAARLEQECALLCAAALDRVAYDGAVAGQLAQLAARHTAASQALRQSAARVESLEQALAADRDASRDAQALRESLAAERQRVQRLEGQLQERSELVLSLEAEHAQQREKLTAAASEAATLRAALTKAESHAHAHADYITQLDDRLDRQKDLLLGLEEELARTQADHAAAVREHNGAVAERDAELRALRLQLAGLQTLLKQESDAAVDPAVAAGPIDSGTRADRDQQTLRVLHQQLLDARARNDGLLARVRELETAAAGHGSAAGADELTRIRGVGPRLAEHLRSLGFSTLDDVATLNPRALDDPDHALASLKARILRDRWIEQAAALGER